MLNKYYFNITLLLLAMTLQGCQVRSTETQRLLNDSQDRLLCEFDFDEFNNRIYDFWLQEKFPPTADEFQTQVFSELQKNEGWANLTDEEQDKISNSIFHYYQFLTEQVTATTLGAKEKLQLLTSLELGDHTKEKNDLQERWSEEKQKFASEISSLQVPLSSLCAERKRKPKINPVLQNSRPAETPDEIPFYKASSVRVVEGVRRVFATAYQSCDVLKVKALSSQVPNIEGIKILSEPHESGRGRQRVYQDVQKIFKTNPYYALNAPIHKGCYANTTQPLVYDFGGKPNATTDPNSPLDFFSNAGSGTDVLGVDCSGFIFSAIARGGLKFAPNKNLKAVLVHGTSASMFKNPSQNGLTCFDSVVDLKTRTIEPGDIIASDGHAVMVDRVGSDPFGIRRAKNASDCTTNKLTSSGFDFTILQSGNWKNGIGIHQSLAKDYLKSDLVLKKRTQVYAHYRNYFRSQQVFYN